MKQPQNCRQFDGLAFMDCNEAFGAVVRAERERRGLTQRDIAARTGLHLNFIGRIERAQAMPSLQTVLLIADALEMPAEQLVGMVVRSITTGRLAPRLK
ncbi:helix-turn-helix transcriptional regulator [Aquabacterium sp. A7-Y]|uniref:helix-turn-helix domain-containing protein n=1 Tax=Aquabacterium sp. A7-Y TaxID=1349605 RepID=UPI00223D118F|nr:helix-turn-helix transcriptional regulator [Aquabacterium sp. A7-Y]MCW7538829.1 helix-turn-helix transcriptional regulator [Aquabacterium sp. A7-Y]